jgi:predicted XRE-type DNA-binding protein
MHRHDAGWRQIGEDIWVIDAFQKKSKSGIKTPQMDVDRIKGRLAAEGDVTMTKDDLEMVRGSGNVFRDLGHPDADILHAKAVLAAKIIGVLDDLGISVRRAHELTGFAAADFSRVRQAKLQRFSIERLISMLVKLNDDVEVSLDVRPRGHGHVMPA